MPVTLGLFNTVFLLLQTGAVHRYLLTRLSRLILEARQIPELQVPGEGPAGGVDQEVRQLPDDVRESHQWEIIHLSHRELSHVVCWLNLSLSNFHNHFIPYENPVLSKLMELYNRVIMSVLVQCQYCTTPGFHLKKKEGEWSGLDKRAKRLAETNLFKWVT